MCAFLYVNGKNILPLLLALRKWALHWQLFHTLLVWGKVGPTWLTILFSQVFPCFPDIALSVWVFSNLRMLFSQKVHCFPPADFVYSLIFPKQNWTVVPWLTLKSISLSIVFRRNKGGQIFFNPFCVSKNTESYCSCFVLLQVLKEINFKTNIFWC